MNNVSLNLRWSDLFEKNIISIGEVNLREDGTPDCSDAKTLEYLVKNLSKDAVFYSTENGDYISVGLKIFTLQEGDMAGSILSAYSQIMTFNKVEAFVNEKKSELTNFAKKVLREAKELGFSINQTNELEYGNNGTDIYFIIKGNRMFFLNKKNDDVIFSVGRA